jgi:hypothetical protein
MTTHGGSINIITTGGGFRSGMTVDTSANAVQVESPER